MKKRQTELDILRIMAAIAVIAMHACSNRLIKPYLDSSIPVIVVLVWCVPVFIMISGRFLLDDRRSIEIRDIYRKYILRIVIVFVIWSAVYQAYYVISGIYDNLNWKGVICSYFEGPYHFWYLYMLAGLYVITPFLQRLAADEKLLRYYIVSYFAVSIVTQYGIYLPKIGANISSIVEHFNLNFLIGYSGYFMIGWYIHRTEFSRRKEFVIYTAGVLALILTYTLEYHASEAQREVDMFKQYLKPNVVVMSGALFTLFDKRISRVKFSKKTQHIFSKLSEYSFGVYIIHALINEFVAYIPLPFAEKAPYMLWAVVTVIVFSVSLIITWLIRKIPYIGKKIT